MMLRVTAIVPLCFMADANASQLTANRTSMDELADKVASTVMDRLLSRVMDTSMTHPAELDDATIAKPCHRRSKTATPLRSTSHTISKPTKKRGYFGIFGRRGDTAEEVDDIGSETGASPPKAKTISKPIKKTGYFARMFGRRSDSAAIQSKGADDDAFEKEIAAPLPESLEVPSAAQRAGDLYEGQGPTEVADVSEEMPTSRLAAPVEPETGVVEQVPIEAQNDVQTALPKTFQRGFLSPRQYVKPSEEEQEIQSKRQKILWRGHEDALRSALRSQETSVKVNQSPLRHVAAAAVQYPAAAPDSMDITLDSMESNHLAKSIQ
jgi:hypothetical protein